MSVVVEFDNGVRAFWNMCKTMPQVFALEVFGTAGIVRVDDTGNATVIVQNGQRFGQHTLPRPQYTLGHIAGCVDEMVQLIHHGGRPSMDGRTSRQVVEVLLAALQSQHAGNARITLPISDA